MANQYGLDNQYFEKWIERSFSNGLKNWKPDELARELCRMAKAADHKVMAEPEFALENIEDILVNGEQNGKS